MPAAARSSRALVEGASVRSAPGVDLADHPPGEGAGAADAVAGGEPRDVGLVDRDAGHAEPAGRGDGARPEEEGRGDVHDVGFEVGQLAG